MGLKVFAPATIANLSIGFDVLGVALDAPGDDIVIKKSNTKGLKITKIKGAKNIPFDIMKNTAGYAAYKLLEHLGMTDYPIDMEIYKKMPFGSGMGSSAASAVAGVIAVNYLLDEPLHKRELLPFAAAGEQLASGGLHLDNVAPSLIGGIVLTRDALSMDITRIYTPKGIVFLIIHPNVKILTADSRSNLNKSVLLSNAIKQTANIGAFVSACYTSNFDMIKRSMTDHMIEDQRKDTIPLYDQMKDIALNHGALGFNISGSGPAMFAMCKNTRDIENIRESAYKLYNDNNVEMTTYVSAINHEGAYKY